MNYTYETGKSELAKSVSPIEESFNRLSSKVSDLENLSQRLYSETSFICRPTNPLSETCEDMDKQQQSQFVETIEHHTERITQACYTLESILDRLEI